MRKTHQRLAVTESSDRDVRLPALAVTVSTVAIQLTGKELVSVLIAMVVPILGHLIVSVEMKTMDHVVFMVRHKYTLLHLSNDC